jgi:hypothetical protein
MNTLQKIVASFGNRLEESRGKRELFDRFEIALGKSILPSQGESAAIALDSPKTAALVFDRVWGLGPDIPQEVRFGSATDFEFGKMLSMYMLMKKQQAHGHNRLFPDFTSEQLSESLMLAKKFRKELCLSTSSNSVFQFLDLLGDIYKETPSPPENLNNISAFFSKRLAEAYRQEANLEVYPVYSSEANRDSEYVPGKYPVLVIALSNLDLVDEEKLEWKQVLDFRSDSVARRKLSSLHRWADTQMVGHSASDITEEIEARLEDYKWATQKHGIETALGALSATLDPRTLTSAGLVGGALGLSSSLKLAFFLE